MNTPSTDHTPSAQSAPRRQPAGSTVASRLELRMVGMVIGLATGVDYMANLMFSIAGPHIEGGVLASQDVYLWAVTSYAAAASLAILVMGRLADRMTYRRHTLLSLLIFIAGTLMCAAAEGGTMLIVGRAVQGFGGGPMLSTSRIFVQHSPAHERRTMMKGMIYGIFGLTCVSPVLSAALTEQFGWRAIFVAQLLVAVMVCGLVAAFYPHPHRHERTGDFASLDWPSAIAFGLAALIALHGFQQARFVHPDGSPAQVLPILAVVALVAWIGIRQTGHPLPWVDLRATLQRRFMVGMVFYAIYYGFASAWSFLSSSLLQNGLGFRYETTAQFMSLSGLVTLLLGIANFQLTDYLPRKHVLIAIGFVLMAGAMLWLSRTAMPGASAGVLAPGFVMEGMVGMLVVIQVAGLTYVDLPAEDFGHAYQFKGIMRAWAQAFGTLLATLMLQRGQAQHRTDLVGHVSALTPSWLWPHPLQGAELVRLSAEIDRQATLLACSDLFVWGAAIALVCAVAILVQRTLR
ncbi:MFS transporter [Ralstonia nicotianae]|uniref:MFS transporter n=1 Tax=Ralstonia pseudosolanacearum TaxID=1310165 RepID=UPI0005781C50|nr:MULTISPECIES: MFS transporter [Ralstonia]APF87147.1 MFS transporter [Ralstonia solanacearum FJAT-1458]ARS56080.1 MFS transporter [Ralstonia solanacearum FJAT-91]AXV69419.1 MFS transporter [Ralstonia solanacearum]AXV95848.1 MFS transporter [Ralstonia solanacearum]AXW01052.1 MFS transporter [Ralstonia solanacearum]